MISIKAFFAALLVVLGSASTAEAYSDKGRAIAFNIYIQRYHDNSCKDAIGKYRRKHNDQRVTIKGDKVGGACHNFKHGGGGFSSYDFKWSPRGFYEADTAQDDPTLGKHGKRKYCSIQVFEDEHCEGKEVHVLPEANTWKNIERCKGFDGIGQSVLVKCELH